MIRCPQCGHENPDGATTCAQCGAALAAAAAPEAPVSGAPAPWEDTQRPIVERWIDTAKQVALQPVDFYRHLQPITGDWIKPYLFALICAYIGGLVSWVYSSLFSLSAMFMPAGMRSIPLMTAGSLITVLFLTPFMVALGLLIGTVIFHLILALLKGTSHGIEATYRVCSYAYVGSLAQVVPFLGGLIQAVWTLILLVIGLREVHRTTTGKALIAVLLPAVVLCLCVLLIALVTGAALVGLMRSAQGL